jgi:hypothetical protein
MTALTLPSIQILADGRQQTNRGFLQSVRAVIRSSPGKPHTARIASRPSLPEVPVPHFASRHLASAPPRSQGCEVMATGRSPCAQPSAGRGLNGANCVQVPAPTD